MRKTLLTIIAILLPLTAGATKISLPAPSHFVPDAIPAQYTSTSETTVLEWGCPVSEVVNAETGAEAIQQISRECIAEVTKAATEKDDVFEVIEASIIWPDIAVSEESGGFRLQGTFFLETLVLRGPNR